MASNGKVDPKVGKLVRDHLLKLGLETTVTTTPKQGDAHTRMYNGVQGFLQAMGLDINDPSIRETPERVADMFVHELCYGLNYDNFPKCTTTPNGVYDENDSLYGSINEMVMVDSIRTYSLCEHHFQTIAGVTHIAYIPGAKLLGLSKFARVTNFFGRRPQVQERMTAQIYEALAFILQTEDIAVMQVATHDCMRVRGAMDPQSKTTTSKMGGRFMTNPALRQEFLNAIPRGN